MADISNSVGNTIITGTATDDSIYNDEGSSVTINAGAGNDTIYNWWADNVSINAGEGNDSIYSSGNRVTINAGTGDDYINDNNYNVLFQYAGGNDVIEGFDSTSTLQIMSGESIASGLLSNNGDATLTIGQNVVTLKKIGALEQINVADSNGNTTTFNLTVNKSVTGTEQSDDIVNYISGATVSALGGNDTVDNGDSGANSYIDAGAGNDSIRNEAENATIAGGDGTDTVYNYFGSNTSISGGEGNDSIYNDYGNLVTIDGGAGDDTIINNDDYVLFKYTGGKDVIEGFNSTSTLQIIAGSIESYSWSGNDIVLTIGENTVTLKEMKSRNINRINVINAASNAETLVLPVTISGTNNADSISNEDSSDATIDALGGNDTVENSGENMSVSGGEGRDYIYNTGKNSKIEGGADNDSIANKADNVKIYGGTGNDTVINGYTEYSYNEEGGDSVTIDGGDGDDVIQNYYVSYHVGGKVISISGGAGNDSITNSKGNNVTIEGGDGKDTVKNSNGDNILIDGGADDDFLENIGGKNVTIEGGDGNNAISNNGNDVVINSGTGNDIITNYHNKIEEDSTDDDYHYNNDEVSYGKNVTFQYVGGDDTINGFDATSTLQIGDGNGTYSTTKSGNDIVVTAGNGSVNLIGAAALSEIHIAGDEIELVPTWRINGTIATYGTNKNTLVTVTGVQNINGITINDKTVTIPQAALNNSIPVSIIGEGYTLALADDVIKPTTTEAGWTIDGTTATYKDAAITAGYKLENNQISYVEASGGATLAIVSGVNSTDGLSVSGKVVTVAQASLGTNKVTISGDGYTLALADDVTATKTTKAWSYNNSAATYTQTTTAGYALANNAITYSKSATKNLITLNGVQSKDGLSVKGKVVTVSKAALGTSKVTVTKGYTLALGDDVDKPTTTAAKWTHSGTTATYKSSSKKAGYTLASKNTAITYSSATNASTLATVKGIKVDATPAVKGSVITLTKANFKSTKVTVDSNDYEFNLATGDYRGTSITGSKKVDVITSNGKNLSIAGGAGNDSIKVLGNATTVTGGTGNDTLTSNGKGGNVFVYANGDGNDVITNFGKSDKIKITKGTAQVALSGKDVVFTVGKGKITVKGAASKTVTYIDSKGDEHTYPKSGVSISGASVKLSADYLENNFNVADYGSKIQIVDASAVIHNLKITGNKLSNTVTGSAQDDYIDGGAGTDALRGGAGNDTLIGGKGNDYLTGGAGDDVFVYSEGDGNDTIYNYNSRDKIQIKKGTAKIAKKGKDVIFTVGSGRITVKDAADKVITYIDASGKLKYYPAKVENSMIINGTTVKLLEEYKNATFDVAGNVKNGNKVKMIDASSTSHNLKIIGNAQNNLILGGSGNNTINGGKGNDTLQGGDGSKNIFLYNDGDGNDVIVDYNAGDKINLTSGSLSSSSVKDSDVVLTVGKGKITLTNGTAKVITVVDKDGNNRIIGNNAANEIHGGTGNDTISGGKGNDSLWGDKGNDTFIYANGDGKDTIMDYQSGDLLQIVGGSFSKSAYSKGTLTLTVGNGSIIMKNVTNTTAFNINDTNYKISGSKLVKK